MEAPSYPISEEEVAYLSPPLPDVRGLHPVQKQFVALYEDIYEARVDENHKEPLYGAHYLPSITPLVIQRLLPKIYLKALPPLLISLAVRCK